MASVSFHQTSCAAISEFLPEVLGEFLAAHPGINVDLEERLSYGIVQAISEDCAELGILAGNRSLGFAELPEEPFIGLGEGSALQDHLASHASQLGRRLDHRVRLRSFDAVCCLVERGVGIGVIPEAAARRCQRSMAIRRIPLREPWALRELLLCVRDAQQLSVPARLLAHALRAQEARGAAGP